MIQTIFVKHFLSNFVTKVQVTYYSYKIMIFLHMDLKNSDIIFLSRIHQSVIGTCIQIRLDLYYYDLNIFANFFFFLLGKYKLYTSYY